jgi:hypothetical protein
VPKDVVDITGIGGILIVEKQETSAPAISNVTFYAQTYD